MNKREWGVVIYRVALLAVLFWVALSLQDIARWGIFVILRGEGGSPFVR